MLSARLLNHLKYPLRSALLILAPIFMTAPSAWAEAIFLFRSPSATAQHTPAPSANPRKSLLRLDEKGDLLIQCGCARFTVAYNAPIDQLKPSEQQQPAQREPNTNINGISLTASLAF